MYIKEDCVSWETGKLMGDNGFDQDYPRSYYDYRIIDGVYIAPVPCPTLQLARKWIKENYKNHIEVRITNHSISDMVNVIRYYWIIFDAETARWMDESTIYKTDGFDTEEQAYENALRHILENIENYDENNERKKRD